MCQLLGMNCNVPTDICFSFAGFHRRGGVTDKHVEALARTTAELRRFGDCNYLLSNGEVLFAHCATQLGFIVRKAPFQKAHLVDEDYTVDFGLVTTPSDKVAVIATKPLTDNEAWTMMAPGELMLFQEGEPMATLRQEGSA